jgi:hypothetical protein
MCFTIDDAHTVPQARGTDFTPESGEAVSRETTVGRSVDRCNANTPARLITGNGRTAE